MCAIAAIPGLVVLRAVFVLAIFSLLAASVRRAGAPITMLVGLLAVWVSARATVPTPTSSCAEMARMRSRSNSAMDPRTSNRSRLVGAVGDLGTAGVG